VKGWSVSGSVRWQKSSFPGDGDGNNGPEIAPVDGATGLRESDGRVHGRGVRRLRADPAAFRHPCTSPCVPQEAGAKNGTSRPRDQSDDPGGRHDRTRIARGVDPGRHGRGRSTTSSRGSGAPGGISGLIRAGADEEAAPAGSFRRGRMAGPTVGGYPVGRRTMEVWREWRHCHDGSQDDRQAG
jgi:hypothetical protein